MKILVIALGMPLAVASPSSWIRENYPYALVVARSEQIVVGHLEPGSIRYVEHPRGPDDGMSWEYLTTLTVSEVLKGDLKPGRVPLTIHYGLDLKVVSEDNRRGDAVVGAIQLWDSGNSAFSGSPHISDARMDHLWFLRKRADSYGRRAGVGHWGIVDPEDVASVEFKDVILAYLSDDPETRLATLSAKDPAIARGCADFLASPDLKPILAEDHPYLRAEKLLLFLIRNDRHRQDKPIQAEVEWAGAELARLFVHEEPLETFKGDMMTVWGSLRYEPSVKLLIRTLREQKEYWSKQTLEPGWEKTDVVTGLEQKSLAGVARSAIVALGRIGSPDARTVLEETRALWNAKGAAGNVMVSECDAALRALPAK